MDTKTRTRSCRTLREGNGCAFWPRISPMAIATSLVNAPRPRRKRSAAKLLFIRFSSSRPPNARVSVGSRATKSEDAALKTAALRSTPKQIPRYLSSRRHEGKFPRDDRRVLSCRCFHDEEPFLRPVQHHIVIGGHPILLGGRSLGENRDFWRVFPLPIGHFPFAP